MTDASTSTAEAAPERRFDVAVIGAGPGGYVAAIRAAQLGMRTAIVEREHLGGICLNWGCIPTKALLRSAELYHQLQRAGEFGLVADAVRFDLDKIIARSRAVSERLANGVGYLMKKNRIAVIDGTACLESGGKVAVTAKDGSEMPSIEAKHIVIATGARARELPNIKADGRLVWTYKHAMLPKTLPSSLLIVGSGAIGIEFASFYRSLGCEVTVIEMLDRILPGEDGEISALAHKAFAKQGIAIRTDTTVERLEFRYDSVLTHLKKSDGATETLETERVVLAIGIVGNVEGLGLERLGVRVEKTHIVVDEWCRTSVPGLYAIGDVVGPPWLAHKASHEGVLCVENIAGIEGLLPLDASSVPACTYSSPQIASVGLTEEAARAAGRSLKMGRFPYQANGKALVLGETEGLIKTIFDADTGELLGAHLIGAEVTELIQGFAIARQLETTEAELASTIFPHPTLSEMMGESVLDAYGRALHI